MRDLFFVDPRHGLQKSYAQLLQDVAIVAEPVNLIETNDCYQLFTQLLAAMVNNVGVAIHSASPHSTPNFDFANKSDVVPPSHIVAVHRDVNARSRFDFSELQQKVREYTGHIGISTSGTSGRPKMVRHKIETLTRSIQIHAHHDHDIWGLCYDPASFAGLQVFLQAVCNHNTLVRLIDLPAKAIHDAIDLNQITHLSATPTLLRLICSDDRKHEGVRQVTSGGEIADTWLVDRVVEAFPNARFKNIYASTELGSLLTSEGDIFQVPERLSGQIVVIDGRLAVHASLAANSIEIPGGSPFFDTGDCVDVLSEQPLTFRFNSRKSDWINVGGNKVNPHELERYLLAIEGIEEARVFGIQNSVTGSMVSCEVVIRAGSPMQESFIRRELAKHLPGHKIPRMIRFVQRIESSRTGKKLRSDS